MKQNGFGGRQWLPPAHHPDGIRRNFGRNKINWTLHGPRIKKKRNSSMKKIRGEKSVLKKGEQNQSKARIKI